MAEDDSGKGETHEIWMWPFDEFLKVNEELKSNTDADVVAVTQFFQGVGKSAKQVRLLGAMGRAYKHTAANGREYIIFKGYAGQRPNLNGTRYLASNPKVSCFVVGTKDIIEDAAKGTKVAIIAFVAIDVIEELKEERFSFASLGVRILSDVIQGVAAAAAGAAAGVVLTTVGVPTVIVFATIVIVGFVAGVTFARLDREYDLTARARSAMMDYERRIGTRIEDERRVLEEKVSGAIDTVNSVRQATGTVISGVYTVIKVWRRIEEFIESDVPAVLR